VRDEGYPAREADRLLVAAIHHNNEEEAREIYYLKQLSIMRDALCNLTRLDCFVNEDGCSGALFVAADSLFEFLCSADKLRNLGLGFKAAQSTRLSPDDIGPTILLDRLAERKPWAHIERMHLSVETNDDTLSRFLAAHKATLRTLRLSHTHLIGHGPTGTPWEAVLSSIGRTRELEDLELSELSDLAAGFRPRFLFNPRLKYWRIKERSYPAFYADVIPRILCGDDHFDIDPEWSELQASGYVQ
jgi:hypothetical protein